MKKISLIISTFFIAISAFAQIDEVKLIVSGTASTKEKATSIALRSAIEQAFGTFVSKTKLSPYRLVILDNTKNSPLFYFQTINIL